MSAIPSYIQRQLSEAPPGNPGRHDAWKSLSVQMKGEGIPEDVIFAELRRWIPDPDKKDKELWDLIKGAAKLNPQPATAGGTLGNYRRFSQAEQAPKPFEHKSRVELLPSDLSDTTPGEFLQRLFEPDDFICLTKPKTWTDEVMTVREWITELDQFADFYSSKDGHYFLINPLLDQVSERKNEQVARFLYGLVELEVPKKERASMSQEQKRTACEGFYGTLLDSKLPLVAIYTSGDASIHGLVRIDAPDQKQFDERVAQVYDYCATMPGFDKSNKNSGRLSRLPGVMRGEEKQTLLHWATGAESFQAWSDSLQIDDGLPPIDSDDDLEGEKMEEPSELVRGVLHKGSKMVIGSNSKGRKTMLLMDLGLSVASGTDWLGYETVKGRVLYINLELQKFFFRKRRTNIAKAKGLTDRARFSSNFDSWTLRGHAGDASNLVPAFINKVQSRQYDLIIIDPTYKLMGANRDENATKDIASLLNEFEKLAVQTGAAVVFVSHFSKGNQAAKEAIDRISGSGVFARDPDTIMTLTAHEEPDAMIVDLTLRNFPPVEQYTVKWNDNWLFERVGLDPKRAKKPAGRSAKYSSDQLLDVLGDQELTCKEWKEACEDQEGIKKDAFYGLRKELEADKKVYQSELDKKWSKTARQMSREGN